MKRLSGNIGAVITAARDIANANGCPVWIEKAGILNGYHGGYLIHETPTGLDNRIDDAIIIEPED